MFKKGLSSEMSGFFGAVHAVAGLTGNGFDVAEYCFHFFLELAAADVVARNKPEKAARVQIGWCLFDEGVAKFSSCSLRWVEKDGIEQLSVQTRILVSGDDGYHDACVLGVFLGKCCGAFVDVGECDVALVASLFQRDAERAVAAAEVEDAGAGFKGGFFNEERGAGVDFGVGENARVRVKCEVGATEVRFDNVGRAFRGWFWGVIVVGHSWRMWGIIP